SQPSHWCSLSISITRPVGARNSSLGTVAASHWRLVTSKRASRPLESVSSGPKTRKLRCSVFSFATSRRKRPSTCVSPMPRTPGEGTSTAYSRKSGIRRSRSRMPPLAWGFAPKGERRMGANPHANGGILLRDLRMPDFREYAVDVHSPGVRGIGDTHVLGRFLRDVAKLNTEQRNFRVFGPD